MALAGRKCGPRMRNGLIAHNEKEEVDKSDYFEHCSPLSVCFDSKMGSFFRICIE